MHAADEPIHFHRYDRMGWNTVEAGVVSEAPVSLSVNGSVWLTMLCTPSQLEELAVGFLYNEAIIQTIDEVAALHLCDQGSTMDVWLHSRVEKPEQWRRTSGCTGGVTRADISTPPVLTSPDFQFSPGEVLAGMEQMLAAQTLYHAARGVHCSALSDGREIRAQAEDIGRHNTLDKIAGILLLQKLDFEPRMVLTTGRISSEMLMKSIRLGARVVVSRTSPTHLSIRMAQEAGITLVGYVRSGRFNVYTVPERLGFHPDPVALPKTMDAPV